MTITLRPGSTAMFTGDSITHGWRDDHEARLGFGFPLRIAGEWGLRHPDRPINWLNTGEPGDTTGDLAARWDAEILAARPDLVTILVGINDVGRHYYDPEHRPVSAAEFADRYDRLLRTLTGVDVILVEPFLLPIDGVIEVGPVKVDAAVRRLWRADLDPKIRVVRELAREHGAQLLSADTMFAELSAVAAAEHWADDGVHPSPAGHAALAEAWLRLVE